MIQEVIIKKTFLKKHKKISSRVCDSIAYVDYYIVCSSIASVAPSTVCSSIASVVP
jgi:hypothetical protein